MDREAYVEAVLRLVEAVPAGRVTTYGAVADRVGAGGPRQVGRVMATHGGPVPWWRVVRADGSLPVSLRRLARQHYLAEGTALDGELSQAPRVNLAAAMWTPDRGEDVGGP